MECPGLVADDLSGFLDGFQTGVCDDNYRGRSATIRMARYQSRPKPRGGSMALSSSRSELVVEQYRAWYRDFTVKQNAAAPTAARHNAAPGRLAARVVGGPGAARYDRH